MKNIDRRRSYGIMIDTETCNSIEDALTYDIGYAVIDSKGNVYETRSLTIRDIFVGEHELMESAYYAEKLPQYLEDLFLGDRVMVNFNEAQSILRADIANYGCTFVVAHNANFDRNSLNTTLRWLTASRRRYFMPFNLVWQDTLKGCRQILGDSPMYREYCEKHGFMTKHKTPRPQMTAEVVYRYITGDTDFVESHTALEDVLIEAKIYAYLKSRHKKLDMSL